MLTMYDWSKGPTRRVPVSPSLSLACFRLSDSPSISERMNTSEGNFAAKNYSGTLQRFRWTMVPT
jgi:hypothetical protein